MAPLEKEVVADPRDADLPEESPYLRRQKPVPVRRRRMSMRMRVVLVALAILGSLGIVFCGLFWYAMTSPHFVLTSPQDLVVAGNHTVSREEVLSVLELPLTGNPREGANVFRISLEARRRQVETLPWVRTATVTRILPHGLLVHITERTPVAYASVNGRVCMVDADGMLLDKPDSGDFDFPVLYGLENLSSQEDRRDRLALYRQFMQDVAGDAGGAGWSISEVYLEDGEDLKALLINEPQTLQVHFGSKDFRQRFGNFLNLLPGIQKSNTKIDSVDLRYKDQIVVDPQTPDTPAGKAASAAGGGRKGESKGGAQE